MGTASASPRALLHDWEALMRRAVHAARCHRPLEARRLYQRARALACRLLAWPTTPSHELRDDDRVAAFVVTHLNLAESLAEAGLTAQAAACLCDAHRRLAALRHDDKVPASLQLAAHRHSRETHAALLAHLAEHGAAPDVADTLHDGAMPFVPDAAQVH